MTFEGCLGVCEGFVTFEGFVGVCEGFVTFEGCLGVCETVCVLVKRVRRLDGGLRVVVYKKNEK